VQRLSQAKQNLAEAQLALREHEKCKAYKSENEDLRAQLVNCNKHMQALKKELNRVKTSYNTTIANLEEEIRRLEAELGDYRGDTEQRQKLIDAARAKFAQMRPQIGCEFQNGPATGVLITSVMPGKPMDLAGGQRGDIVEQVNGHDTLNNADFKREVKKFRPGDQVPFQIDRNNAIMTLVVEVGSPGMTREEILTTRRIASGLIHQSDLL
jgi:C-terminal processing protease CtpA/Prc